MLKKFNSERLDEVSIPSPIRPDDSVLHNRGYLAEILCGHWYSDSSTVGTVFETFIRAPTGTGKMFFFQYFSE